MILIKNGCLVDPKSGIEKVTDVLIQKDKILKIEENISPSDECQVIDAAGLAVLPGLVDVHVHFRDPGFTHKEDIYTGAKAAAKGGITTVVLMANTKPTVDTVETLEYVINKGKETAINVYTCANVTYGMKGEEITPMEELYKAGAVGFTDDGIPLKDQAIVKKAMEMTRALNVPISFHEEDPKFITNNGINPGVAGRVYGLAGSPREAEITMIDRDLKIALETDAIVDIQHISARESVELVRQAKKLGKNIHAEATPHHFTLTEDAVEKYGTLAKMNPPLREEADRMAIIEGLVDGTIDMIATDHAPHAVEEKAKPVTEAPSGILGLETALGLGIKVLVKGGYMNLCKLMEKMAYNPAKMYNLDKGYLAEGGPADLILVDVDKLWKVDGYQSKSENCPFTGWELPGKIMKTICGGKVIYEAED